MTNSKSNIKTSEKKAKTQISQDKCDHGFIIYFEGVLHVTSSTKVEDNPFPQNTFVMFCDGMGWPWFRPKLGCSFSYGESCDFKGLMTFLVRDISVGVRDDGFWLKVNLL